MNSGADELRAFWRRAVGLANLLILVGAVVLYVSLRDGRSAALGFVLGGATSVLRFNLRYRALVRARSVGSLVRARLLSYALNALVLAVAFGFRGTVSPWTTAAGLLVTNAAVIAAEVLSSWKELGRSPAGVGEGP